MPPLAPIINKKKYCEFEEGKGSLRTITVFKFNNYNSRLQLGMNGIRKRGPLFLIKKRVYGKNCTDRRWAPTWCQSSIWFKIERKTVPVSGKSVCLIVVEIWQFPLERERKFLFQSWNEIIKKKNQNMRPRLIPTSNLEYFSSICCIFWVHTTIFGIK